MNNNNNFEQWRPVVGYDGYAVSSMGRVKSLNYHRTGREQILKPSKTYKGYLKVTLYQSGVKKYPLVHRLVAEAFIPNPDNLPQINHKIEGDEGKLINTVENLEWCTQEYNNAYGTRTERSAKALTNRSDQSKKVYQYTLAGELVKEWVSAHEIERQTGWHQQAISQCCNNSYNPNGTGAHNVYKNYIWRYE